jgi:hypothetical protein
MRGEDQNEPAWARVSLRAWILLAGAAALAVACWELARRARATVQPRPAQSAAALPARLPPEELTETEADREASPVSGYRREVVRPNPVQNVVSAASREEPAQGPQPGGPQNRKRDEKKTLPEIFRMPPDAGLAVAAAAPVADRKREPERSAPREFAPFGRLIRCQLVDTIDSVTARSEPIVALVTQDLDWNGSVVIPAGSEAFSYAGPEAVVDGDGVGRLVDTGEWTLVLPAAAGGTNGRELALKGRAVNRIEQVVDARGKPRSWGLDDGADGLVGYTLSTLDSREIELFAAAAVSGMAQGLGAVAERQVPAPGVSGVLGATQIAPTLGNAAVGALSASAIDAVNEVASRIRQEISRRGVYVRIPAGKEFYLFVEQTIDPGRAVVGLRLPAEPGGTR